MADSKKGKSPEPTQRETQRETAQLEVPPSSEGQLMKGNSSKQAARSTSPAHLPIELQLKVRTQVGRLTSLQDLLNSLASGTEDVSLEEIEDVQGQVTEMYKTFCKEHAHFEVVWPAQCADHEYFSDNVFLKVQRVYSSAKRELSRIKAQLKKSDSSSRPSADHCTKLPDITLPTFKGDYSQWPAFSELFKSLILNNSRLSAVEKLHYLKGCLEDQPAQLVANLPLTNASLSQAWELLTSRYENTRLLINSHLDQICNLPTLSSKSAKALSQMHSTVAEAYKALEALNAIQHLGDHMVVYQLTNHLDRSTREAWETSLGSSTEYPSFSQLSSFLTTRIRAMERIESSPQQAAPLKRTVTAHHSVSSSSQASSTSPLTTYPCDCCGGKHFVVSCEKFRTMKATERREFVEQKRLCYNCLGRHNVRSCRSTQGCKTCASRHHSMLHETSQRSAQPSTSRSGQ